MISGAHLASHLRKSDLDCSHRQVAWVVKSEEEKQTSLTNYFPDDVSFCSLLQILQLYNIAIIFHLGGFWISSLTT